MKRVVEGSRPTLIGKFYDVDNIAITPSSISYRVTRTDTGADLVANTSVTPAQRIEVILPVASTTLDSSDEYPVRIAVTVTAIYSNGAVTVDEVFFIVIPAQ